LQAFFAQLVEKSFENCTLGKSKSEDAPQALVVNPFAAVQGMDPFFQKIALVSAMLFIDQI
jgi:hypothetical protein